MGDANAGFLKPDHREPPNRPFSEAHPARRRRRRAPVDPAEPAAAVWFGLQMLLSLPPLRRGCKCGDGPELASARVCVCGGRVHTGARARRGEQNFTFRYRSAASPRG